MKKIWMLTMAIVLGMGLKPIRGEAANQTVTVYMESDALIPAVTVLRAAMQASRNFAKIGTSVQFRHGQIGKRHGPSNLELDLHIQMEAPAGVHSGVLAQAHPFQQVGRIEVFYSRITNYDPVPDRVLLLAYVLTHEIAHVLEGIHRHSPTGVMKEKWNLEDCANIRAAKLEFEPTDIALIRTGIENRMGEARQAEEISSKLTATKVE